MPTVCPEGSVLVHAGRVVLELRDVVAEGPRRVGAVGGHARPGAVAMPTTGFVMCWGAEPKYPASPKAVTAPLESVSQYPPGSADAIATTGRARAWPPSDPSIAGVAEGEDPAVGRHHQVAAGVGEVAPTIGAWRVSLPSDPANPASPKAKTPPSEAKSQ